MDCSRIGKSSCEVEGREVIDEELKEGKRRERGRGSTRTTTRHSRIDQATHQAYTQSDLI